MPVRRIAVGVRGVRAHRARGSAGTLRQVNVSAVLELEFAVPAWQPADACAVAVVLHASAPYFLAHSALLDAPRRTVFLQLVRCYLSFIACVSVRFLALRQILWLTVARPQALDGYSEELVASGRRLAAVPGRTSVGVRAAAGRALRIVKAAADPLLSDLTELRYEVRTSSMCEADAPALAVVDPDPLRVPPACRVRWRTGETGCEARIPADCGCDAHAVCVADRALTGFLLCCSAGSIEWPADLWTGGPDSCRVVLDPARAPGAVCGAERLVLLDSEWRVGKRADGAAEGVTLRRVNDIALVAERKSSSVSLPSWMALYERLVAPPITHAGSEDAPVLATPRGTSLRADFVNDCEHGVLQLHNGGDRDSVLYFRSQTHGSCFDIELTIIGSRRLAFDFYDGKSATVHLYGTLDTSLPSKLRLSAPSSDLVLHIG